GLLDTAWVRGEQVVAKHDRPVGNPFEERWPVVPIVLCEPILDADDRIGVDPSANAVDQPTWKDPLSRDPIPLSAREVTGRDIETERKVDSRSKAAVGDGIDDELEQLFDRFGRGRQSAFVGFQSALT